MEQLEHLIPYIATGVISLLISWGVFARPKDVEAVKTAFAEEKARLVQYISENYVKESVYRDNHTALEECMGHIQHDIADLKNLLIKISGNRFIDN